MTKQEAEAFIGKKVSVLFKNGVKRAPKVLRTVDEGRAYFAVPGHLFREVISLKRIKKLI